MNLPSLGVKRPILTSVVFIIILLIGIISLINLPIELLPDISFPYISVITSYEGTGPEEIESTITKLIEGVVSTVPNIKKVYSTSAEGLSIVGLEFEWETDLDAASNDIRDKIDQIINYLPSEAKKPYLLKMSTENIPVMMMGVRAKESYPKLYEIIDKKVIDILKQVDGVANSLAFGGLIREIRVDLNQAKINSYKITIDNIIQQLRNNKAYLPGGEIRIGNSEFILRIPAEYNNLDEIRNIVIGNSQGIPVYLKNVADVKDTFKQDNMIVRVNNDSGLMVIVQKQSKANTVTVSRKVKQKIKEIEKNLPEDVKLDISMDTSKYILDSIHTLTTSIFFGFIFVLLIVFLFLIDWKPSFVITLTIPFSLIAAFIVLFLMGYTINIMSLSSLAIAIGMVVDNAIVVIENIYRYRFEMNWDRKKASVAGTVEVMQPVIASTLTTVAIFVPIFFVTGLVNVMFRELSLSIITVLSTSLFVSLFLSPMVASLLFTKKSSQQFFLKAEKINDKTLSEVKRIYNKILDKALRHKMATILFTIGLFFFSVIVILGFFVGKEFAPQEDQGMVMGSIELESTAKIENTDKIMYKIEQIINQKVPEKEICITRSGRSPGGRGAASGREEGVNIGFLMLKVVDKAKRDRSVMDILAMLNDEIRMIPGIKSVDLSTDMGGGFGTGKPVIVEIYGYDLEKTMDYAKEVRKILKSIKGTDNIIISRKPGKAEIQIQIDKKKAHDLGLTLYQIANTIKNSFSGVTATSYREQGDEYDIFVRLREQDRKSIDHVKNTLIPTPSGQFVSVGNLANFEIKVGPKDITRKQKERYLTVSCGIYGRNLSDIVSEFNTKIADIPLPEGIRYELTGSAEDMRETFTILLQVLILGMLLVFLIMAAQFESWRDPFIVMFSVPFAIVGVIWGLFITGQTFNMNSFVGLVMLVGIVVNNAIVLIDKINLQRREEGLKIVEAIKTGCTIRLRPVLMTALTTVFGLMPMALARGEGSESWVPLGVSVIGGLFASTIITLVLIPVIYDLFELKTHYAGFWRRFFAFVIDDIIIFIALSILYGLGGIAAHNAPPVMALKVLLFLTGVLLYFSIMESSKYQGTLGKIIIRIKVTDLDEKPITFNRALKRNIFKPVSFLILLFGFILAGLTEKKQSWHDIIAKALVVKK